jgi:hypothetical protein
MTHAKGTRGSTGEESSTFLIFGLRGSARPCCNAVSARVECLEVGVSGGENALLRKPKIAKTGLLR